MTGLLLFMCGLHQFSLRKWTQNDNQFTNTKFTQPITKIAKSTDNHHPSGGPEELQRRDAYDACGGGRGGAAESAQVQRQAVSAPEAGARLAPLEGDAGMK